MKSAVAPVEKQAAMAFSAVAGGDAGAWYGFADSENANPVNGSVQMRTVGL